MTKAQQKAINNNQVRCAYCLNKFTVRNFATIDHFYPSSKGDPNRMWNKFIVCKTCNLIKGNWLPHEFVERVKNRLKIRGDQQDNWSNDARDIIRSVSAIDRELRIWFDNGDIL